ncbi:MAG: exodeoxyribonuclease VII large subunit [Acidobacteriota bacterium]
MMKMINAVINGHNVTIAFDKDSIHIYNGYFIKDDLKLRGYRFDPENKSWFINPSDPEKELEFLKNNLNEPEDPGLMESSFGETGEKELSSEFPSSFSIPELRSRINRVIQENFSGSIWVRGIIASEVKSYKWYSYFDLKDENKESSIYFKVELNKKNLEKIEKKLIKTGVADRLEKDLPVFCRMEVKIPTTNLVDIRLNMTDILPEYTQSKIKNQREITVERLKEENIFLNQKELILPKLLTKIALITSEQGTSIKDIIAGLSPYENKYDFYFLDSRMEGATAVESLVGSIDFIESFNDIKFDAVIIARGGGSEQSLSVFNDYSLCKKICMFKLPVITAIGHEKDLSAIELCSHITPVPSTPSGVGKFLNNRFYYMQNELSENISSIFSFFNTMQKSELEKVYSFMRHIPVIGGNLITLKKERLVFRIKKYGDHILSSIRENYRNIEKRVLSLLKKDLFLIKKNVEKTGISGMKLIERSKALRKREMSILRRSFERIDFKKREKENTMVLEKVGTGTEKIFAEALKKLTNSQKEIFLKKEIITANDPEKVLKKGFTLTVDQENRVISSINEFRKREVKILKFFDGSAEIEEKERK